MRTFQFSEEDIKDIFSDLLQLEDVEGVVFFSLNGGPLFSHFPFSSFELHDSERWWDPLIMDLSGFHEVELVFGKRRFYIRKASTGYLLVIMGVFAPMPMVRLNCDLILPSLQPKKTPKGIKRFFSRKQK